MVSINPLTFDEYKTKVNRLFLDKGNSEEDLKHVDFVIQKYEVMLESFYEGDEDVFSDERLMHYITRADYYAKMEHTEFPMSLEEFEEKLVNLFLKGSEHPCTESEKVERLKCLKELDVVSPDWIEGDYRQSCYRYLELEDEGLSPDYAFSDEFLLKNQVDMLEMCYF